MVKNLPATQKTQEARARSLGREDAEGHGNPLQAPEEPGRPQSMGLQRVGHD